jgi:hypothetical protein
MTWDTTAKSCSSCGIFSQICDDFETCLACVDCPQGQAIQISSGWQFQSKPHYACSNSSSSCPAGSGKYNGDFGGCTVCPIDQFNDGTSGACRPCPEVTFPRYDVRNGGLWRGATFCSSQCPEGTGEFKNEVTYQKSNGQMLVSADFSRGSLQNLAEQLGGSWPSFIPDDDEERFLGQACFPCGYWYIREGNVCKPCGDGASDRATLNSMGNTFAFATRCVRNICPWPYVVASGPMTNEMWRNVERRKFDSGSPPEYSTLSTYVPGVCGTNIHLGGTITTISVIAFIMLLIYSVSISFAAAGRDEQLTSTRRRNLLVGMLMTTASPAVDFISDLMYIVSTLFFNDIICIVCIFFYMLPMFFFWRMLQRHGVHFGFYFGKPPAFAVMEKYDSFPKALLGLAGYLPLYLVNLPVLLPLFVAGHVLYCCKVFPISRVSNLWLHLYTRSNKHTSSVVIIIPLLQESIFEEMLTESVPQMIIQIVNNTLTNGWGPLSYFSTSMSALMILDGVWRLVYYRLYLKIKIDAIPTDLSRDVFNFQCIAEGENSLGKSVKAEILLEMGSIVSAVPPPPPIHATVTCCNLMLLQMAESDEFSPLIQRHVSASAAELRAEMQVLKSDIRDLNAVVADLRVELHALKSGSKLEQVLT